jgi:hypothetical protein
MIAFHFAVFGIAMLALYVNGVERAMYVVYLAYLLVWASRQFHEARR